VRFKVVLEPSNEGGYTVYAPSLPGCISEGDTVEESLENIRKAIELYLEPMDDGCSSNIRFANEKDYDYLISYDPHVTSEMMRDKIEQGEVIVICDREQILGWLRFGYFCDVIPFMNMLYLEEKYRRRGLGTKLVGFWENEMKNRGYDKVMTSSNSDEQAQHFYRKLGYRDCGALLLPGDTLEIIFLKSL